jgi:multicomponent Na+:H+ antiporter subunit F
MTLFGYPLMTVTMTLVWIMMGISVFLALFRLVRGPSLPDRVVALDLITALAVGIIATFSIDMEEPIYLDVASVAALIAFLGTVAFARYLERRGRDE